jgi:hypothetical protein
MGIERVGHEVNTHLHFVPRLTNGIVPLLALYAFTAWARTTLPLPNLNAIYYARIEYTTITAMSQQ